jgi:hypothetical protein
METEPNDPYEQCEQTEARHKQASVGLRSLEREVLRDDGADPGRLHAGGMERGNNVHVRA